MRCFISTIAGSMTSILSHWVSIAHSGTMVTITLWYLDRAGVPLSETFRMK